MSQRLLKPQRQLELASNENSIPVNDRQASLVSLGLGKGGALRVALKGDGLLDTKSMFEGVLPAQGESVQYQEAETQYMKALGRSLEHSSFAGLGLGLEPELDEKVVKPGQKGIVTGQTIADKVVLSNKFAHLAQPGYVPAEVEKDDIKKRHSRSRSRDEKRTKHKRSKRSRSRSRSRRRRNKKRESRSRSRDRRKHRKSRSRSREAQNKEGRENDERGRRKQQHESRSRSKSETRKNVANKNLGPPTMNYLSLDNIVSAEIPKRLLAQQEDKALAIRAKLKKLKPISIGSEEEHNDREDKDNVNLIKKVTEARDLVAAARKRNLNQAASADEDFSAENRVKAVLKKRFANDTVTADDSGNRDGGLQFLRSNLNRTRNRESVMAAFEDDEQRDLSAVQDLLLTGSPSKPKSKRHQFNPHDIDRDHFNAIFSSSSTATSDQLIESEQESIVEEKKPSLSWRERAKALALERNK